MSFIDEHRDDYGVEPICAQLPIAPSMYYEHKVCERGSEYLPPRVQCIRELSDEVQRVWGDDFQVYGVRKVLRQLNRENITVARCTDCFLGKP